MSDNTKLAQTGTKQSVTNTRCSICREKDEKKREAVNRALGRGIALRDIEAMTGISYRTIANHAEHLPTIYKEAKEKAILSQAIDVDAELREQLVFAKDLRLAARGYLSDPETGELTLMPRADEISVVYEDYKDTTPTGAPKKKTDTLDVLLERTKTGSIYPTRTIIKHVDIRSFALDAIKTADVVIDKFARIAGSYKADNEPKPPQINYTEIKQLIIRDIKAFSDEHTFTANYESAVRAFIAAKKAQGVVVSEEVFRVEAWELAG